MLVTAIQRFCTHDGPGIRTTVFLKGCALSCAWCHNPETQSAKKALYYNEKLCIACGVCAAVCRCHTVGEGKHSFNRADCSACMKCVPLCPSGALEECGKEMRISEILDTVQRDLSFYGQNGGLTLSGGEPMFHPEEALALLREARRVGIHTCLETSGFFDEKYIPQLAACTDVFLWDYKDSDPDRHRQYTGVGNEMILRNLSALNAYRADVRLRCIIVAGVNDRFSHMDAIAELYHRLDCIHSVELLAYHPFGTAKAGLLGHTVPEHREWIPGNLTPYKDYLREKGVCVYE